MRLRRLRETDHGPVVAAVERWWDGRRVAGKLPRLLFRYFTETSFAVEEEGFRLVVRFGGFPAYTLNFERPGVATKSR